MKLYIENDNLSTTIKMGEIIGYRIWGVNFVNNTLSSWVIDKHCWLPNDIMIAEPSLMDFVTVYLDYPDSMILRRKIEAKRVLLGIHAWKTYDLVLEYQRYQAWTPLIIGKIQMWGSVIEHVHGYRSTHAKIVSILAYKNLPHEEFLKIKKKYDLPIGQSPYGEELPDTIDATYPGKPGAGRQVLKK